jgi:hypothetical protein
MSSGETASTSKSPTGTFVVCECCEHAIEIVHDEGFVELFLWQRIQQRDQGRLANAWGALRGRRSGTTSVILSAQSTEALVEALRPGGASSI